jgi:hypothetical protein
MSLRRHRYCNLPALAVCMVLLSGTGCATYQSKSSAQLNAFKAGHSQRAIRFYEKQQTGRDKQLFMVEAGRLKLLDGDFAGSHGEFVKAIDQVFDLQEGAMIRLKDVGGTLLSSTLLDDTTRPYNLASFEAVFAFQQQALNSIFLGDIEAATVELRRAIFAQDLIAEKYERDIEKAKAEADQSVAASMDSVNDYYATMGPVLGRAKSGFQNPYVWYLSGLMLELQRDNGNAYIAYKKAWELMPENQSLQRDLLRLARNQNPQEYESFSKRFSIPAPAQDGNGGELIIIYEEGLISQRYSEGIPIFVFNGFQKITFPVYRDGPYYPAHIRAYASDQLLGSLMPICFAQSLAYHDLNEKIPGIAARNITRFITREIAKSAGQKSNDDAVKLVSFIFAGIASLADEADTRGWYSLPMVVQLLRVPVSAGTHSFRLAGNHSIAGKEISINIDSGEIKLLWIADLGPRSSIGVASLNQQDKSSPQFMKTGTGGPYTAQFLAPAVIPPAAQSIE